jgi:hypothetical protein
LWALIADTFRYTANRLSAEQLAARHPHLAVNQHLEADYTAAFEAEAEACGLS